MAEPPIVSSTDQRVEQVIGNLLRTGVILSVVVVLAGGIAYLIEHGSEPSGHHAFRSVPPYLRDVGQVVRAALSLDSRAIMQLGLLLLILTPVARVVFTVFAFLWQRDYLYSAITVAVLGILLFSLLSDQL